MLLPLLPSESKAEANSRHSLFPLLSLFWRNNLSSLSAAASWRILKRYMWYFPLMGAWALCRAFPPPPACSKKVSALLLAWQYRKFLADRLSLKEAGILKCSRSMSKPHSFSAALWISVSRCNFFPSAVFSILHLFNFLCSSAYGWQTNQCLSSGPQNICLCGMSLAAFSVSHHLLVILISFNVWFMYWAQRTIILFRARKWGNRKKT